MQTENEGWRRRARTRTRGFFHGKNSGEEKVWRRREGHAVERHGEPDIRMASTGLRAEGAGVGAGKGQSREATGYTR